jgi:hypothetical protein
MILSIPLNPPRILPDVRDVIVFHFVPNTSCNFENDLIQPLRTQYIDVVARVCTPAGNRRHRSVRELVHDARSHHGTSITKAIRTSIVVTLMPAGFHLGRFQPSAHIAPKLSRLTVPSPSPILTPLRTWTYVSVHDHFLLCSCIPWVWRHHPCMLHLSSYSLSWDH